VWADIQQVWTNCRTFNRPGDPVYVQGQQAEQLMAQAWASAGLPAMPHYG
jgi:hypothetical protein